MSVARIQVKTNSRARPLKVGHAEALVRAIDGAQNDFRLLSSRRSRLSETFLELLVGDLEDEQSEIDVGPRIVSAIVPAARTSFERFVVAILVLLDEPFEADESANLVAELVGL